MVAFNQQVIADQLNISRTTVSRCFTNHKGINPKTRASVFSLAAKLGYQYLQPRTPARASARERSIGVLIGVEAETFGHGADETQGAELLPGISEFAQLHHWQTDVHFVSPRMQSLADPGYAALRGLRKRLWSGLLLMHSFSPQVIAELSALFPCVALAGHFGSGTIDSVDANHARGVTALFKRLRQRGHRRIGFLTRKHPAEAIGAQRRLSAYLENLLRLDLPLDAHDVIHLDPEADAAGYDRAAERTRAGVTAWMCECDREAYGLIAALDQRGLRVPEDVSVTGFDGMPRPAGAPALDTVRIPYHEIGFVGSRRLLEKIDKRYESPHEILLECHVQEGETIAAPRGASA
jgi:DNA-binding LacI/PurR family transcriptional regulator